MIIRLFFYDYFFVVGIRDTMRASPSIGHKPQDTALVMQDLYGGDVYECKVQGKRHYVNITPEGYLHDFTASQFGEEQIMYSDMKLRTRKSLLKSKSVKERYELLKMRMEAI